MTVKVSDARTVKEVAAELGVGESTADRYVHACSKVLFDNKHRQLKKTTAIGIDETLFVKLKAMRTKSYNTVVVDLNTGKFIDVIEGKARQSIIEWFGRLPEFFRHEIKYVTLDMCRTYRSVAKTVFPKAKLVVDRFHVMKLANKNIDQIRAMLQRPGESDRRRKNHPLYKARKLFRRNASSLNNEQKTVLEKALELGDPTGILTLAYLVKEATRDIYFLSKQQAQSRIDEIHKMLNNASVPDQLRSFGNTLKEWETEILNWHDCHLTNSRAEAANNNLKRIKRLGYGFKNFEHFRNRVLLCAGNPDMRVLQSMRL